MNAETISVIDFATNLGKQKAHIFKILRRLGIETIKEKNSAAKAQKISYITIEDYERIKEHLAENEPGVATTQPDVGGVFMRSRLIIVRGIPLCRGYESAPNPLFKKGNQSGYHVASYGSDSREATLS